MIQGFGDRRIEGIWNGVSSAKARSFPAQLLQEAHDKLDMLNAAAALADLKTPPGNHLEKLKGDLDGYHAIRINKQWRIIFRWTDGGPTDVEIVDYH